MWFRLNRAQHGSRTQIFTAPSDKSIPCNFGFKNFSLVLSEVFRFQIFWTLCISYIIPYCIILYIYEMDFSIKNGSPFENNKNYRIICYILLYNFIIYLTYILFQSYLSEDQKVKLCAEFEQTYVIAYDRKEQKKDDDNVVS